MLVETVLAAAVVVAVFGTFGLVLASVDSIASAKAITYEEEQAARRQSAPVTASPAEFKQAA